MLQRHSGHPYPEICHKIKRDGQRCTRLALKGEEYCRQHSPKKRRNLITVFLGIVAMIASAILLYTNVFKNVHDIITIVNPSKTPTPLPRADKLYFAFIVDASNRMSATFDGNKTKWDSVREAALNNLIWGLPSRANFGLILLGGSATGKSTNCDQVDMAFPIGPDNRNSIENLISSQQPQGVASLAKSIDLARDKLLDLADDSTVKDLELFVFLGGGDSCSNNDLRPLLYFIQNSGRYLTQTHVDIFLLSNEPIDRDVLSQIQNSNQAGENIRVNITTNTAELVTAVNQSYLDTKERAREVEPIAVAAQETIVVEYPIYSQSVVNTIRDTAIPINNINTTTEIVISEVPSFTLTVTPSITPSRTPLPIPTTQVPPTPIPPTEIPPTPIPTQPISWDTTCPNSIYGARKVIDSGYEHFEVREIATNKIKFITYAQFHEGNSVKACTFSGDNTLFGAAYHYGDNGGYTWIGIWDISSGSLVNQKTTDGWQYDISGFVP